MRAYRRSAAFALLGLIWGSEWLASQTLELPPLKSLAIRYALAFFMLAATGAILRRRPPKLRESVAIAITGVMLLAWPAMMTFWAAARISPGLLVVLLSLTPLIAALLEGRANGRLLALLLGGVAGTILIAAQGLSFAATQWEGAGAALLAAASIAGSVVYVKRALCKTHPVVLAGVQLAAASIVLAGASLTVEGRWMPFSMSGPAEWELALALFGSAVALPLYYWLLRRAESFQMTASQWLATAVGVAEGLILERELPPWRILAGLALTSVSMIALWRRRTDDDDRVTFQLTSPAPKG